jgi:gamma-glutamyltranspeptidase/glutathione hydrolase
VNDVRQTQQIRSVLAALLAIAVAPVWQSAAPAGAASRPLVEGRNGAISAGDPRATAAGYQMLLRGGNAFDAGVAALLAAAVVEQDLFSLGGERLILVYDRRAGKVTSINGQGWAPAKATIDWYTSRGKDLRGEGLDPAVVPGALHGALTVLERWGSLRFEDVAAPAIELADQGFVLRPRTAATIQQSAEFIRKWPDNARTWLRPAGALHAPGDLIRMPDLAATLRKIVEAERAGQPLGRAKAIAAARDRFYKGDIALAMVAFLHERGTPFEYGDFAEYTARIEEPTKTTYRGYTVYKQTFNSQGPVLLQMLNILETFDLRRMKHNSAEYLHTLVEAMKLAYADRDTYYADPQFVKIPATGLLSKEYGALGPRSSTPRRPSGGLSPGTPWRTMPTSKRGSTGGLTFQTAVSSRGLPRNCTQVIRTRPTSPSWMGRGTSSTARRAAGGSTVGSCSAGRESS